MSCFSQQGEWKLFTHSISNETAMHSKKPPRLAAFITAHGFGHSTRAIAVLQAAQKRIPELELRLFTTAPAHLFDESLHNFQFIPVKNDVGLIQHDALKADIPATITSLSEMLPFSDLLISSMTRHLDGCSAVLCDISPLGIVAAAAAGIPSILVENFTWDWIYQPYARKYPDIVPHIAALNQIYGSATHHIQTEPICNPDHNLPSCGPVFRSNRTDPVMLEKFRKTLCTGERSLVLVSMGGFEFSMPDWPAMKAMDDFFFILAGQAEQKRIDNHVLTLRHDSGYYHPDLIAAADLVICKSGYSTIAECYQAGTRVIAIDRPFFAESPVLGRFIKQHLAGKIISEEDFLNGSWLDMLENRLKQPAPPAAQTNCADQIATLLLSYCRRGSQP